MGAISEITNKTFSTKVFGKKIHMNDCSIFRGVSKGIATRFSKKNAIKCVRNPGWVISGRILKGNAWSIPKGSCGRVSRRKEEDFLKESLEKSLEETPVFFF